MIHPPATFEYLDTDVEVIKSLTPFLHDECFLGFQLEEENVDWCNAAVLGAGPGHPFLKRCMELNLKLFDETGEFYRFPTVTTMVLKGMGLREYGLQEVQGVTVYPIEYFYPYPWTGKFSPDCIKENTYCVHYWAGSWLKKEFRQVALPRRIIRKIVHTLPAWFNRDGGQ